jgi:hypothetical protein
MSSKLILNLFAFILNVSKQGEKIFHQILIKGLLKKYIQVTDVVVAPIGGGSRIINFIFLCFSFARDSDFFSILHAKTRVRLYPKRPHFLQSHPLKRKKRKEKRQADGEGAGGVGEEVLVRLFICT